MYEVKLEQFAGPVEKLLELIEGKKMEITELNLAAITADFLDYVNNLKKTEEKTRIDPRFLADFIVVASQLLLIKSRVLLPELKLTEEEEGEIKDLENRLRFYQQFKPAMNCLKDLWNKDNHSFSRPLFAGRPTFFYPSDNITIKNLFGSLGKIFQDFQLFTINQGVIKSPLIKLEEKIEEIINNLKSELQFSKLIQKKSKSEIVVLFLALLQLLAGQVIVAEQKDGFSEISIKRLAK